MPQTVRVSQPGSGPKLCNNNIQSWGLYESIPFDLEPSRKVQEAHHSDGDISHSMRISQNGREIMEGSGLLDIMQESDMITSGSINGVMKFSKFSKSTNQLLSCVKGSSIKASIARLSEEKDMNDFLLSFLKYREDVRQGEHGKTAELWISYMDHI